MFDRWFAAVKAAFDDDRTNNDGWGPAERFEGKRGTVSHETIVAAALSRAGFHAEDTAYPRTPRLHADGVVSHRDHHQGLLRYELKSVFIPHYHSADHPHNPDFERLLRFEHPNGALGDVERLKSAGDAVKVLLLIGVSWTAPDQAEKLSTYQRHRDVLLETFANLADLTHPTASHALAGDGKPWSAVLRAWVI